MTATPPYLVISPHLDDGVLSCGHLLAANPGSIVLTALAGSPATWTPVTPWDALCGFSNGDDVVAARLLEDESALNALGATQRVIKALDGQYEPVGNRTELIRRGIDTALHELQPKGCVIPLGLQHPDHVEVRQIALSAIGSSHREVEWLVYEDLPYGPTDRDRRFHAEATDAFTAAGFTLAEAPPRHNVNAAAKQAAMECYVSQLEGLRLSASFDADTDVESYWSLTPVRGQFPVRGFGHQMSAPLAVMFNSR